MTKSQKVKSFKTFCLILNFNHKQIKMRSLRRSRQRSYSRIMYMSSSFKTWSKEHNQTSRSKTKFLRIIELSEQLDENKNCKKRDENRQLSKESNKLNSRNKKGKRC